MKKARTYRFRVTVDHGLDMPRIQAEPRADRRAGRARPDLMIMGILSPDEVLNAKIDASDNENILKTCKDKFELCYMLTRCTENLANALY